jgi:hypothetical protein
MAEKAAKAKTSTSRRRTNYLGQIAEFLRLDVGELCSRNAGKSSLSLPHFSIKVAIRAGHESFGHQTASFKDMAGPTSSKAQIPDLEHLSAIFTSSVVPPRRFNRLAVPAPSGRHHQNGSWTVLGCIQAGTP